MRSETHDSRRLNEPSDGCRTLDFIEHCARESLRETAFLCRMKKRKRGATADEWDGDGRTRFASISSEDRSAEPIEVKAEGSLM